MKHDHLPLLPLYVIKPYLHALPMELGYSAWYDNISARYEGMGSYTGRLDGFLARSIPAFLKVNDGENNEKSLFFDGSMIYCYQR